MRPMNISIGNPYAKSGITTAISALSFVVWAGSVTNYQNVADAELGASERYTNRQKKGKECRIKTEL